MIEVIQFDELANAIVEQITLNWLEINNNLDFNRKIRKISSEPKIQCGTRYIFRELVRSFFINQRLNIKKNHAIDLLHSVVPIAYCDYVLLDKYWVTQIHQMRNRFDKSKI